MSSIYELLFQKDQLIGQNLESILALPNLTGGFDFKARSGEVLASSKSDVFNDGQILLDSNGETIAHFSENIMGGDKIDFGFGNVINGHPNIFGGENYSSIEGMIGFTSPNFDNGFDFFSVGGEKLFSTSPDFINGGTQFHEAINPEIPYLLSQPIDISSSFEMADAISSQIDVYEMTSALEFANFDAIDFLTGWF